MPQGRHVKLKELTMNVITNCEVHKVEVKITGCEENKDNGPGWPWGLWSIPPSKIRHRIRSLANGRTNSRVWLHSVWRCHKSQPLWSHQLTGACKCISPSRLPHLPANMTWYRMPCVFGTAKAINLQFPNLEHKQGAPSSSFDPPKWWTSVWSGVHGPTWRVEMICGASYRRCLGWCNDLIELANGLWLWHWKHRGCKVSSQEKH